MAIVDICEYEKLTQDALGSWVPTGREPATKFQQVVIGGGSLQSAVFGDTTRFVRVHVDAVARIQFGSNPTAAPTTMRMAAGATEFFGVTPGHKLAVISSS